MANRASSPFPTSHDTIGLSTYNTSAFAPSSPFKAPRSNRKPFPQRKTNEHSRLRAPSRRASTVVKKPLPSSDESDSEANLSDYTFDLNKLPGELAGIGKDEIQRVSTGSNDKESDGLSDLDGPDDFTLNMIELMKSTTSEDQQELNGNADDDGGDVRADDEEEDDEGEEDEQRKVAGLDDYSEIEPPLEASTPAHLLRRKEKLKDDTLLDNGMSHNLDSSHMDTTDSHFHHEQDSEPAAQEVKLLREELRKKDEIIAANNRAASDARSNAQYVRQLQSEFEKQRSYMEDFETRLVESDSEIRQLRAELDERDQQLESRDVHMKRLHDFQHEVKQLRGHLTQDQDEGGAVNGQAHDTSSLIAQLQEKDTLLRETEAKLQAAMASHKVQLEEKAAEIDQLKIRQEVPPPGAEKLSCEIDSVRRERDVLEKRTSDLDRIVQHLESQMTTVQSDLAVVKAENDSWFNAVKSLADEKSLTVVGKTFTEMVELLRSSESSEQTAPKRQKPDNYEQENQAADNDLRIQIQESTSLTRILTLQLESMREELSEARTSLTETRKEKVQLLNAIESLPSDHEELQKKLETATQERDEAIRAIESLQEVSQQQRVTQTLSPPPSPSKFESETKCQHDLDALEKSHQTEIENLQLVHTREVTDLRDSQSKTITNLDSLLSASQAYERELKAELTALRKTLNGQEQELGRLANEQKKLESVIEAKDYAAAELDGKFSKVLRKREQIWEARVDKLLTERERMGKALMWTWGKMEVGDDVSQPREETKGKDKEKNRRENQGYRYRFVEKERDHS